MSDTLIQTVNFGPDILQISYIEMSEQADTVGIARSMVIAIKEVKGEVDEVLESLQDIVDRGLLLLRNPPAAVKSGQGTNSENAVSSSDNGEVA